MSLYVSTLLMRNLQDVFGENDPARLRVSFRDRESRRLKSSRPDHLHINNSGRFSEGPFEVLLKPGGTPGARSTRSRSRLSEFFCTPRDSTSARCATSRSRLADETCAVVQASRR